MNELRDHEDQEQGVQDFERATNPIRQLRLKHLLQFHCEKD